MDACSQGLNELTAAMIGLAKLAVAGGVTVLAFGLIAYVARILDKWRSWQQ